MYGIKSSSEKYGKSVVYTNRNEADWMEYVCTGNDSTGDSAQSAIFFVNFLGDGRGMAVIRYSGVYRPVGPKRRHTAQRRRVNDNKYGELRNVETASFFLGGGYCLCINFWLPFNQLRI